MIKSFIILSLLIGSSLSALGKPIPTRKVKYKTSFVNCPSHSSGRLVLSLLEHFEKTKSLASLKKMIIKENLQEKYFLKDYEIKYSPSKNLLSLNYSCPKPLMKVQLYRENGANSYSAVLVENGQLLDPTYEVLLRREKKLKRDLPSLGLPFGKMSMEAKDRITKIMNSLDKPFSEQIAEVILSPQGELTVILSFFERPTSAFLGSQEWESKFNKLFKIVNYLGTKKKLPSIINLTDSKKVVVKFSDKI